MSCRVADSAVLHSLSLEARYYLITFFAHQSTASEYFPSVGCKDFLVVFLAGNVVNL